MIQSEPGTKSVLLLGTGQMASEYMKVLFRLGLDPKDIMVIGRSRASTEAFAQRFGVCCRPGGTPALSEISVSKTAIVAVSHLQLVEATLALLQRGCRNILLEKPGALYRSQLGELRNQAERCGSRILVGFNRRFYDSVDSARSMIEEDGGLISCRFDFTEIERLILEGDLPKEVLKRWGLVNSLHVIDLFLYLAGMPKDWAYDHGGTLGWHPNAAIFCGSGVTEKGVFFSYLSTWSGAGRWNMELTTRHRRLILCPLETLTIQHEGQFELEQEAGLPVEPEPLKPGLRGQVDAFLRYVSSGVRDSRLCTISEVVDHFEVAEKILGYDS